MKKIGIITQTYDRKDDWSPGSDGKDRSFLINWMLKDSNQLDIRKNVDCHLFTFHNVETDKAKRIANKIKAAIPSTSSFIYNDITFSETILRNFNHLKEKGITDLLWIQDDDFVDELNYKNLLKVIEFYKNNSDVLHIALQNNFESLVNKKLTSIKINDDVVLYKSHATDFEDGYKKFGMDNGPFICNLDLLMNRIYSPEIFSRNIIDAYTLEHNIRFNSVKNNVPRYVTNKSFIVTKNVVGLGGSLGHADIHKKDLTEKYGPVQYI